MNINPDVCAACGQCVEVCPQGAITEGMVMRCYCECVYDNEPQTFFKECVHVARKVHKCCECHKDILPGQKYESQVGIWDGRWYHSKTCLPCAEIRDTLCGECYVIGQLYDAVSDINVADIEKLSSAARNKISEVWG